MNPGFKQGVRFFAWIVECAAFVLLFWTSHALSIETAAPGDEPVFLQGPIEWTKGHATIVIVVAGVAVVVARLCRWAATEKSTEAQSLDHLIVEALNEFRSRCFPGITKDEPVDNNRVTVFRHFQWKWWIWPWRCLLHPWGWIRWPGSGWLVIAYRSGHATQASSTVFLAPDDAPQAEGVAGQAWRCDGTHRVQNLPDLSSVQYPGYFGLIWLQWKANWRSDSPEVQKYTQAKRNVALYAERTGISPRLVWQRIRRKMKLPRSLCGVPLENRSNQRAGVLVLDSCNEIESIDPDSKAIRPAFKKLTRLLRQYGALD